MRNLKKLTLTLVALFAMTTGAWADGTVYNTTVELKDLKVGDVLTEGFSLTTAKGQYIDVKGYKKDGGSPETGDYTQFDAYTATVPGGVTISQSGSNYTPYADSKDANAWIVSDFKDYGSATMLYLDGYNYTPAPAGTALTPDATRKVWTLDAMPAGNVELQVAYFPGMLTLAKAEGGTIAVDGLSLGGPKAFDVPTAWSEDNTTFSANDLPADFAVIDDADLPATIAALSSDPLAMLIYGFDGEKTKLVSYVNGTKGDTDASKYTRSDVLSWIGGGMIVYYATATVIPAGFDTDGTNYYVADKTEFKVNVTPAEGFRLKSLTFGETDVTDKVKDGIATLTMPEGNADIALTATFTDAFELAFEALNTNTIQQGKATVKVGDADKTLGDDGKLSVKAGQTVTLTAKQGYKFRSVEAKKAAKAPTTAQLNVPTGWNGDNTKVSANDLPGFVALTDEEAANIACPDAEGYVYVIHDIPSDGYIKIIAFNNGEKQAQQSFTLGRNHGEIYDDVNDIQIKYYYTTGK